MAAIGAAIGLWALSGMLKKKFKLKNFTPVPRPDFGKGGAQRNFQYLLVFFEGTSGAIQSTIENLSLIFLVFQNYIEEFEFKFWNFYSK